MRTLLLVLCLLAIPASAAAQQPQTAPQLLCAKFEGAKPEELAACRASCAAWPIERPCLLLRRFGYEGVLAANAALAQQRRGAPPDWPALDKRFPGIQRAYTLHNFDLSLDTPVAQLPAVSRALERFYVSQDAYDSQQLDLALTEARAALAAFTTIFGPDHPAHVFILVHLALIHERLNQTADALAAYQHIIKIFDLGGSQESAALHQPLQRSAHILFLLGRYAEASAASSRLLAHSAIAFGPDSLHHTQNLTLATNVYLKSGELQRAHLHALEAAAIAERNPKLDPNVLGAVWNNLAMTYQQSGQLGAARETLERALQHDIKHRGAESPGVGSILNNLASLHHQLGDHDAARAAQERALTIFKKTLGTQHPSYLRALSNLAEIVAAQGRYDEAISLSKEAVALREAALGKDHPDLAISLNNLAALQRYNHQYDAALATYDRAIAIEERVYGAKHHLLARPRHNRAIVLYQLKRFKEANADFRAAIALASTDPAAQPHVLATMLEMAALSFHKDTHDNPWPLAQRAASLRQDAFWRAVQAADSDVQLLSAATLDQEARTLYLRFLIQANRTHDLWTALLEGTGRAARAEQLRRGWLHTLAQRPKSADAAWAAYQAAERVLSAERASAAVYNTTANVDRAERALQDALTTLHKKWPAHAQLRAHERVLVDETCAVLHAEQAAMIHWVRLEPIPAEHDKLPASWLAVVVTPSPHTERNCIITPISLGLAQPIDDAVATWRAAVAQVEQRLTQRKPTEQAAAAMNTANIALYQRVWAPLKNRLGDVKRAYLVPQDRLLDVAFGALIQPDAQPLLARMDLAYLPIPASLTVPATRKAAPGSGALVVGALDFTSEPDPAPSRWQRCAKRGCQTAPQTTPPAASRAPGADACGWRSISWPSVGAEAILIAETLGKRWRKQDVLLVTGASARQDALEAHMPGKRVLHFGTHGFFAPASACQGRVEHARAGLIDDAPGRVGLDPMQLSALVLSGASAAKTSAPSHLDGALTAREIVRLDLSSVEVATLAACETGRGEQVAGEGAQGLSKAFVVAGVREVIVSLWRVPDQETARLMLDLYAAIPAKSKPGQATRALLAAQRTLMRGDDKLTADLTRIFFWAAFIPVVSQPAFGPAARPPKQKPSKRQNKTALLLELFEIDDQRKNKDLLPYIDPGKAMFADPPNSIRSGPVKAP